MAELSTGASGELSDSEASQPLLWGDQQSGEEAYYHSLDFPARRRSRNNTVTSVRSTIEYVKEHVDKEKFLFSVLASLFLYLGFMAAFAPTSSLDMNFRWFHGSVLTESEVYRTYLEALENDNFAGDHVRHYSSQVSSPGDSKSLEYTVEQLKEMGFDPKLEHYYPWSNIPVDSQVKLFKKGEVVFTATLMEECLEDEDPFTCHEKNFKGFHSYSANGNVTASYVYVNYGSIEDYNFLVQNKIDLFNKIHIIRSGLVTPGIQLKNAELYGASGAITFTDPYDDGYITTANGFESYPEGPARHQSSIQRGSVSFFTEYPGDPTSPGFASKNRNTEHLSPDGKIPRIPSLPMSSEEIAPILKELDNKGVRFNDTGGFKDFSYSSGPSLEDVVIQLYNEQKYDILKTTNVIVDVPGIFSQGTIIIGSHRDHWTVGGSGGPSSGSAILLEVARGLSALKSKGWKPLRPIRLISWDGTGQSMLGSTEYAEQHQSVLSQHALAYLNLDSIVTGTKFYCSANPLLRRAVHEASRSISSKLSEGKTLHDEWFQDEEFQFDAPGGTTDSMPFQDFLGIPSADFKFINNRKSDPIYHSHSNYDTSIWLETFLDPEYELHNTMTKLVGLTVLTLSEKVIVPFKIMDYLNEIDTQFKNVKQTTRDTFSNEKDVENSLDHIEINLQNLLNTSALHFDKTATDVQRQALTELPLWLAHRKLSLYGNLLQINKKLIELDTLFLSKNGIPNREWIKHTIYAPDKWHGYKGVTLSGIHEATWKKNKNDLIEFLTVLQTQLINLDLYLS